MEKDDNRHEVSLHLETRGDLPKISEQETSTLIYNDQLNRKNLDKETQPPDYHYLYTPIRNHPNGEFLPKEWRVESDLAFCDLATMHRVVEGNIYLVQETVNQILMQFKSELSGFQHDDLFQEGCFGLIHAVHHYKPKEGNSKKFYWYARSCVRHKVLNFVAREKRRTSTPKSDAELAKILREIHDELSERSDAEILALKKHIDDPKNPIDKVKITRDAVLETPLSELGNRPPNFNNSAQESARYMGFIAILDEWMFQSLAGDARDNSLLTIDESEVATRYFGRSWQRGAMSKKAIAAELGISKNDVAKNLISIRKKMLVVLERSSSFTRPGKRARKRCSLMR